MKKGFLLSAIACGVLMGTVTMQAKTDKKILVQHEMDKQVQNHKQAPKDIVMGMQNTYQALMALQKGDKDSAQKALEAANKNFDEALKEDPTLDLIPIDERLQAYAFDGDAKTILARLKVSEELLKEHDTQTAIDAISVLKDELDITTIYIPMKLYPLATKKALEALKKDNAKQALVDIATAMNSLVAVKAVIPTPLLVAQDLIVSASKLDKNKKEDAQKLLEAAKDEIQRAELLGYTSKHSADYKALTKNIEAIQKEINGKNEVEKMYDKLKSDFRSLLKKTHKDEYKFEDTVSKLEEKALENAHVKGEAAAKAKVEEAQSKEQFEAKEKKDTFAKEAKSDENKTVK